MFISHNSRRWLDQVLALPESTAVEQVLLGVVINLCKTAPAQSGWMKCIYGLLNSYFRFSNGFRSGIGLGPSRCMKSQDIKRPC